MTEPKKKNLYANLKLENVMAARQILGEGYELTNSVKKEHDKLAVLKQAYVLATKQVPDRLKRPKKLFIRELDDFSDTVHMKRKKNLHSLSPDMDLDRKYKRIEEGLNKFRRYTLIDDLEYQDDLVIIDKSSTVQYLTIQELDQYVQVYRKYLQNAYRALRKPINPNK